MSHKQLTVKFEGFDRSEIVYSLKVLKEIALGEVGLVEGENPDIVVCGEDLVSMRKIMDLYPERTVRILFNVELGSLDFNTFDYVIGWEDLSETPRYARMHPALGMEKSAFRSPDQPGFAIRPMSTRGFCSFVATNGLAHPMRDAFFKKLNEVKRVDSWGRHLNNSGAISNSSTGLGYELEKMELESGYRFSIAMENGLFPGYTTEKVFSGVKAGSVPIYWGNPQIGNDINLGRIISLHEFKSIEEAIAEILELDSNLEKLEAKVLEPLMTPEQENKVSQSRQAIIELFLHAIETSRMSGLLRPIGTTTYAREFVLVSALKREERILERNTKIARLLGAMGLLKLFFKLRAMFRLTKKTIGGLLSKGRVGNSQNN